MIHYFKFRQELFDLEPAKDVYVKRPKGRGWPEECPPVRGANGFGFDVLANFDVTFIKKRGNWSVEEDVVVESDFDWASEPEAEGTSLRQQYAWFWEKGQKLPHVITDDVYAEIDNQVKISSFLFLKTDPNEILLVTEVPNLKRGYRAVSALIETDWYPASYPWHVVIELDRSLNRVEIKKGEPISRIIPVRRDAYFAGPMSQASFDEFFARGQKWLATHGEFEHEAAGNGVVDITKTYVKQQVRARFVVMK
jgi:hypothetical protein